jgi:hypothetical protein
VSTIDPAAVILAGFVSCIVVAGLIGQRQRHPPASRFRFEQPAEMALHGLWVRHDLAPGAPFRLIAAGPGDTSPRAGYGDNALADVGLAHTEAAARLVSEYDGLALDAIYSRSASIAAALDPPRSRRYSDPQQETSP